MAAAANKKAAKQGAAKPETKLMEAYLRERGLTRDDVPNYLPVPSVSALPGVKLLGAKSGFMICYPDLAREDIIEGLSRARITDPKPPTDKEGKPIRFTQAAGSGSHLYFPDRMVGAVRAALASATSSDPLLVVEGEVKADKTAKHAPPDTLVVGIAGIQAWSSGGRMLDLLARLASGRVVFVAPDADHRTNPHVNEGLRGLTAALRRAGAESTRVIEWDRAKGKGLDDLLTAVKDPAAEVARLLGSAATREELGTLVSPDVATDPPPVRWLLEHAIPAGKAGVLAGPGGMGKTGWTAGLAIHRALGLPYHGRKVEPGPTLIVSAEDDGDDYAAAFAAYRTRMRLTAAQIKTVNAGIAVLDLVGGGFKVATGEYKPTMDEGAVARLAKRIQGICAARSWEPGRLLVVLETYSRMSSGEGNEDASAALSAIERLTREVAGCTAMYVHHQSKVANKQGDADSTGARGGQALSDNARFLLMLTRPDKDSGYDTEAQKFVAIFTPTKVNRAPPQEATELTRVPVHLSNGQGGWVFESQADRAPVKGQDSIDPARAAAHRQQALHRALLETVREARGRGVVVTATKLRTKGAKGLLDTLVIKAKLYGVPRPPGNVGVVDDLVNSAISAGVLKLGGVVRGGGQELLDAPPEEKQPAKVIPIGKKGRKSLIPDPVMAELVGAAERELLAEMASAEWAAVEPWLVDLMEEEMLAALGRAPVPEPAASL